MSHHEPVLAALEASLRVVGSQNRTVEVLDHFEAYLSSTADWIQNFAVPRLPNPDDWSAPVSELVALFDQRERPLRLEFFRELHPGLAEALEANGLELDRSDPVMSLDAPTLIPTVPSLANGRIFNLDASDELANQFDPQHVVSVFVQS